MTSPQGMVLLQRGSAPPFVELPMEILYKIIYKLSQEDLFHWLLTCTKFSNKILPVLYKLDLGLDPYMRDYEVPYGSYKSLAWACQHGLMGTFDLARKLGADLDHFLELQLDLLGPLSLSPLQVALFYQHEDLAGHLLEAGADATALAFHNGYYSAMHFATSASMVRRLHSAGWTPELHLLDVPYKSVIWWMLQRDAEFGAIEAALDIGVPANDEDSGLSMMHACENHRLDVVRLLLNRGFRFKQQSIVEENLKVGMPGICEQLCLTLALQRAIIEPFDTSTLTELVQLLLEQYSSSEKQDYRSEITWLILATGPDMPLAVRSLLWDSLVVPHGLPQSSDLEGAWERDSVGYIMDIVQDILASNADAVELLGGNLRRILWSIGFCLCAKGGFDWTRVQPLIKTLIGENHEHIDVVCAYPTPFTNPHLTENDEALTLELIATLLENGADAETKFGEEEYGTDLLHRSIGMGAIRRVKLLTDYGASIDPPTLQEMEHPIMFTQDDLGEERLTEMVEAQKEIAKLLSSRRKGFGKKATSS
ncbi:hypothetical protein K445DRAFT_306723 [Daldinia sp. EC12]|nr:hypothetical protein K445DRAFT_306723 [Daldinia sp. EC12]